jgi:hypothetical protein
MSGAFNEQRNQIVRGEIDELRIRPVDDMGHGFDGKFSMTVHESGDNGSEPGDISSRHIRLAIMAGWRHGCFTHSSAGGCCCSEFLRTHHAQQCTAEQRHLLRGSDDLWAGSPKLTTLGNPSFRSPAVQM